MERKSGADSGSEQTTEAGVPQFFIRTGRVFCELWLAESDLRTSGVLRHFQPIIAYSEQEVCLCEPLFAVPPPPPPFTSRFPANHNSRETTPTPGEVVRWMQAAVTISPGPYATGETKKSPDSSLARVRWRNPLLISRASVEKEARPPRTPFPPQPLVNHPPRSRMSAASLGG